MYSTFYIFYQTIFFVCCHMKNTLFHTQYTTMGLGLCAIDWRPGSYRDWFCFQSGLCNWPEVALDGSDKEGPSLVLVALEWKSYSVDILIGPTYLLCWRNERLRTLFRIMKLYTSTLNQWSLTHQWGPVPITLQHTVPPLSIHPLAADLSSLLPHTCLH